MTLESGLGMTVIVINYQFRKCSNKVVDVATIASSCVISSGSLLKNIKDYYDQILLLIFLAS